MARYGRDYRRGGFWGTGASRDYDEDYDYRDYPDRGERFRGNPHGHRGGALDRAAGWPSAYMGFTDTDNEPGFRGNPRGWPRNRAGYGGSYYEGGFGGERSTPARRPLGPLSRGFDRPGYPGGMGGGLRTAYPSNRGGWSGPRYDSGDWDRDYGRTFRNRGFGGRPVDDRYRDDRYRGDRDIGDRVREGWQGLKRGVRDIFRGYDRDYGPRYDRNYRW